MLEATLYLVNMRVARGRLHASKLWGLFCPVG